MTTECVHQRRMMVNRVIYCLDCKEWLYSGLCAKCGRALDDHQGIGTPEPACPKEDAA